MKTEIQDQIDKLLQQDIIEESESPWAAPVVIGKEERRNISILHRL